MTCETPTVQIKYGEHVFLCVGNYEFEIVVPSTIAGESGAESTRDLLEQKLGEGRIENQKAVAAFVRSEVSSSQSAETRDALDRTAWLIDVLAEDGAL